jgi:lysozyme family protein
MISRECRWRALVRDRHHSRDGSAFEVYCAPAQRRSLERRPPFGLPSLDWEDRAIDALAMKKLNEVKLWTIKRSDSSRLAARR